jgi:hypothetical protein
MEITAVTEALIDAVTLAVVATACHEVVDGVGLVVGALARRVDIDPSPVLEILSRLHVDVDPGGDLTSALPALESGVAGRWLARAAEEFAQATTELASPECEACVAALNSSPRSVFGRRAAFGPALAVAADRIAYLNIAVQHATANKADPEESLSALRDAQIAALETRAAVAELVAAAEFAEIDWAVIDIVE